MKKPTDKDEVNPSTSVVDISNHMAKNKPKAAPAPAPEAKMRKMDVYKVLLHTMNGGAFETNHKPFPKKFHVKRDRCGEHSYLEESEGQVLSLVSMQRIMDTISQYADSFKNANFELTPSKAKECAAYWASLKPGLKGEIAPIRQLSEPGYTYHRLPFDFAPGPTPVFDELMGRTTNAHALQAWIGSLFDFDSDRQQYVWIYGQGQNGKGTLARLLTKCLGAAARWDQPPSRDDKFWSSGLLGKRLVIFGDCNNYGFPVSGLFKSLTGGDYIRVEEKGRPSRSELLQCKFLFLSNDTPMVSSQKADMRRAIFCHMDEIVNYIGSAYEDMLWAEVRHIIFKCVEIYKSEITKNGFIIADTEELESIAAENEEPLEVIFMKNFKLVNDSDKPIRDRTYVHPITMQRVMIENGFKDHTAQHRFIRYLKEKYKVRKHYVRFADTEREWRYLGIRELSTFEREQVLGVYLRHT